MAMPSFTMRQFIEAGVHFGHTTRRWNPKMKPYLFGERNGVHIIDLEQTVPLMHRALQQVRDVAAGGGRILFVGTKRQAQEAIKVSAERCGQYYVNHRWLGGMLTNWKTISNSIKRLKTIDDKLSSDDHGLTKKELLGLQRQRDKLERALGGIKEMGALPDMLFIVDTNKEAIAVREARHLGIPVAAVVDSNSDPDGISFPVPGNDDAMRAISTYCDLISNAVLDGLQQELVAAGVDVGEALEPAPEDVEGAEAVAEEAVAEETAAKETGAKETGAKETAAKEADDKEAAAKEADDKEAAAEEAPAKSVDAAEITEAETTASEEASAEPAEAEPAEAEVAEEPEKAKKAG